MERRTLKRDLSVQKIALLRPLLKCTSVDGKSTENPPKFLDTLGVTALIRNTVGNLKFCDHLAKATEAFLNIKMVQLGTLKLRKMSQISTGRDPVILHLSLHRNLKLTYSADAGGIVSECRITSDISTRILAQSVGLLPPPRRFPSSLCLRKLHLKDVY